MTIKLTYWDIRSLGEPIRLMLEYLDLKYEMNYPQSSEEWQKKKFTLDLDFPNLPYYEDGEVRMSQSLAIMRHIARSQQKLNPETDEEARLIDVAEGALIDLRYHWGFLCYNPSFENIKDDFYKDLPNKLRSFEDALGKRKWLGGKISYVDFGVNELLDHIVTLFPNALDKTPNLKKYKSTFDLLPKIKAYRESSRFKRFPINGPVAFWGGKKM